MSIVDFTLSNARRFYSSMGNLLGGKGLTTSKAETPGYPPWVPNGTRIFYSSKGTLGGGEGSGKSIPISVQLGGYNNSLYIIIISIIIISYTNSH